jgi:hypothetical protein
MADVINRDEFIEGARKTAVGEGNPTPNQLLFSSVCIGALCGNEGMGRLPVTRAASSCRELF